MARRQMGSGATALAVAGQGLRQALLAWLQETRGVAALPGGAQAGGRVAAVEGPGARAGDAGMGAWASSRRVSGTGGRVGRQQRLQGAMPGGCAGGKSQGRRMRA
jgi:hypothetical protein